MDIFPVIPFVSLYNRWSVSWRLFSGAFGKWAHRWDDKICEDVLVIAVEYRPELFIFITTRTKGYDGYPSCPGKDHRKNKTNGGRMGVA